jgi:hypothetical protein
MRSRSLLCLLATGTLLAGCDSSPTAAIPDALDCDQVGSISLGQTINGRLDTQDCRLAEDDSPIDYYTFSVSSTRSVSLTMQSDDFDSFLILLDENGDLVQYDDDGDPGSDLGADIQVTLSPGRYYIGANTVYASEGGYYTLYTD